MCAHSPLQQARLQYQPILPKTLRNLASLALVKDKNASNAPLEEIAALFPFLKGTHSLITTSTTHKNHHPLRVGVVFSGGQAPGGHNVISGLYDGLKALNPNSLLFGFCDGPIGILKNRHIPITDDLMDLYRNQGGFHMIGSGRDKIETADQFLAAETTVRALGLDGLVIIGGDDSNTIAALLSNYFLSKKCPTHVVGVPKTIDGDLKSFDIEQSFGFDTASKTYAETIGHLMIDALSAKKYYYFVKLMGRSASHIALECALKTHPNITLISEEIAEMQKDLHTIVNEICDVISARAAQEKNYGIVLVPEGLLEFIPSVTTLIKELNHLLSNSEHEQALHLLSSKEEQIDYIFHRLTHPSQQCFQQLPKNIQKQLLIGRDSHGNVQVSKIETERMLIELVKQELKTRAAAGSYHGKFDPQPLFCGYEGRSCLPSNFDSNYCYALGHVAALLINHGITGHLCCIHNLSLPTEQWEAAAIPLINLMGFEVRHGVNKPVIKKALVDLKGTPFKRFAAHREQWAVQDDYRSPGPVQFFGPLEITEITTMTLQLEASRE